VKTSGLNDHKIPGDLSGEPGLNVLYLLFPNLEFSLVQQNPVKPKGKFFHQSGMLWLNQETAAFPGLEPGQPLEKRIEKGLLIVVPFDPNLALLEQGFEERAFFSKKASPKEFSSKTSKANVRAFVRNCLLNAFEFRKLPFVQLWYYPKQYSTVFCFHVDLDFLDEDTTKTISLFDKLAIEPTWFLNLEAAETCKDKSIVSAITKQRLVGQHGLEHNYWQDDKKSEQNVLLAHKALEKMQVEAKSFSAPNGVWNQGIAKALEKLSYETAIAFSLANDDLPFNPMVQGKKSSVLFIPTHSICIALLKQYDFSETDVTEYFLDVITRNKAANLPIMLYSHPFKEIARFPKAIEKIAEAVKQDKEIWATDYFAFADWWNKRQKSLFSIQFNGMQLAINAKCPKEASFRLVKNGKQFLFPATQKKVDVTKLGKGSQMYSGFIQDTVKKPSPKGKKHLAKSAAGRVISLFKK